METETTSIEVSSEIEELVKQHTEKDTSTVCCEALKKMFNV